MYFPHKRVVSIVFALAMILAFSADAWAVAISPEVVERLRQEGRLEEWVRQWESAAQRGMYDVTPDTPVRSKELKFGDVDTLRPLVVCVDFIDNVQTYDTSQFSELLFSKDFVVSTGSFRDYFWENSYGQHDPNGEVYGWVRAPQTYDYYTWGARGLGPYPHNCQKLVEDILAAIDPYVDFGDYDYDNNGWIDGLMIVHAGPGAEQTGDDWDIHSHRWSISQQIRDGVRIQSYTAQPEMRAGGALITIGVFCHEWGHFMGLHWEEYDSDYSSEGLGNWTVMASGSYNHGGATPAHFSAYCKYLLGWATVITVQSNMMNVEILQAETSPTSYRLWDGGMGGAQFLMVENRQRVLFDSYIPGSGLLIYHVDASMAGNNSEWCPGDPASPHLKNAIEQADGLRELEGCPGYSNDGDLSDPFPGWDDKRAFDDTTSPNSRNYYDNSTEVAVWNISDSDSAMYANFDIEWSRPCLLLDAFTVDDIMGGDGDGRPEPGETVRLYFTISNLWLPASGTEVTVSADTAGINFTDDYSYLGYIASGSSANNYSDPVEFTVDPDFPGRPTIFTLHIEANSGSHVVEYYEEVWAGRAEILVVDDAGDYQSYMTAPLDSLRQIYDIWDAYSKADPDFSFGAYSILIWYTGDHQTDLFTEAQAESVMSFLDSGGRLFLTSQDAAEVLSSSAESWDQDLLTNYLHVGYNGSNSKFLVVGRTGDEVGDTLYLYPNYTVSNQSSKDNLVPDAETDTVLSYTVGGSGHWWEPSELVAGTKFQNDIFKVVLFGFGFESIRDDGGYFQGQYCSTPQLVLQRVLDWLKLPGPTLNVMSPNGGETWFIGDSADVVWESISFSDDIKIEYSTNAGVDWSTIAASTTNDGVYRLEVPNTPSESCLVIISDASDGSPADTSDDYFSIADYVAGDANGSGEVETGDVVYLISYLFRNGPPPVPMAAGDANNNCEVEAGDVVYLLEYLFRNGPPPLPGCA